MNGDGVVSVPDLLLVLRDYGRVAAPAGLPTDVNADGRVTVADLLLVLGAFGRRCQLGPPAAAATASPFTRPGLTAPPHLVFVLADVRTALPRLLLSPPGGHKCITAQAQGDHSLPC